MRGIRYALSVATGVEVGHHRGATDTALDRTPGSGLDTPASRAARPPGLWTLPFVRGERHDRPLLHRAARGGRPRDRPGARPRAAASARLPRDDRLRELRSGLGPAVAGFGADQQVRRGLPRSPLLRRLRRGRRRRGARDRAGEVAVRRRVRQRPAALGCDGERRRAARDRPPRRHAARSLARPGRSPDPRHEDQLLGPPVQHRRVRRRSRDLDHRHGRSASPRRRAQAEGHHRRLVGLPAPARLRRLPRDRRRGRRAAVGRHGALRRTRRRGPAPEPGAVRRCRLLDGAQDDRRPAFGLHPHERRRHRQEDQHAPSSRVSRADPSCT